MSKNNTLILVGGLVALVILIAVVAFLLLSGQPSFDTQAFEDYIMRFDNNDEITVQSVEVDTSGDVASTIEVTANEPCYAFGYITSVVSGYEDLDILTLNINSNTDTAISTTIPMSILNRFFAGGDNTAEFDVYVPEVCME